MVRDAIKKESVWMTERHSFKLLLGLFQWHDPGGGGSHLMLR